MSYKAQQWVLEQDDVNGVDKWVLFMLAYRDNHEPPHGCFPSLSRLAHDCGFARSTIQCSVERLQASGKIKIEKRRDPKGDRDSNFYSLPLVYREPVHVGREPVHGVPAGRPRVYRQPVPNLKRTKTEPIDALSRKFYLDSENILRCVDCNRMIAESRAAQKQHSYVCKKAKSA